MIIYDLGKNTVQKAVSAVADIFSIPVAQLNTKHAKKLKKSFGIAQMKEHLIYHTWNHQYELVKKILTIHQEIGKEKELIPDWMNENEQWEYRYGLLEGELELLYKELLDFAKGKYSLDVDTSLIKIKEDKTYWSLTLLEQNNLQAKTSDESTEPQQTIH